MDMAKVLLLLLLVLLVTASAAAMERNIITHVKGFDGPLPFSLETGYVEVDETHGAELFYYFIQSERSPREDPLILWITGGPGCSALSGLLFEIGPLKFDVAGYTQGFPRLVYFEDSWTKVSNVIFLDAPVGTGFSYARDEQGLNVSLTGTGRQLRVFLQKWLAQHTEFASNPLYIGGDSYSGYTVPVTALDIANHPEGGLNLKGYLVGNAATDDKYDIGGKVPFMHGMGLISDELYEAAQGSCRGDFVTTPPRNAQCANAMQDISQATWAVNPVHILEPMCGLALRPPTPTTRSARMLVQEQDMLRLPVECRDNGYRLSYVWADDAEVRETLGIREGSIGAWSRCTTLTHFRHDLRSTIPYHGNLTRRGYRGLVYNGDHDMDMTFVGTQAWIRTLGYPVVAPWRPWYANRQVAGFTTEYAYNLTFATVKGGGHTAPEYRPKECLAMLDRWTSTVAACSSSGRPAQGRPFPDSGAAPAIGARSSPSTDVNLPLAGFRDRCRSRRAALLPRPAPRRPRQKRLPPSVVRRSKRVAGRFAPGTPIKQHQRTLMLQLGIAREGETIGEEALQAYLRYFDKPMTEEDLAACLALFGCLPSDLPLAGDEDVVVS